MFFQIYMRYDTFCIPLLEMQMALRLPRIMIPSFIASKTESHQFCGASFISSVLSGNDIKERKSSRGISSPLVGVADESDLRIGTLHGDEKRFVCVIRQEHFPRTKKADKT